MRNSMKIACTIKTVGVITIKGADPAIKGIKCIGTYDRIKDS
jgi:hypothetical protein